MIFKKGIEVNPENESNTFAATQKFIGENLLFPPPPKLPGYEIAQYFQETFLEFPSNTDPETLIISHGDDISTQKNGKKELGMINASRTHGANQISPTSDKAPESPTNTINIETQLDYGLHMLKTQFQMDPTHYNYSIFSCAIQGTAYVILEKRSVTWSAEPYALLPDSKKLLESPLPKPIPPWKVDVSDYLPNKLVVPMDISVEVPDSTVYRVCFKCKGNGVLRMDSEVILCSTCLGLSTLRLSLRLRVYWYPKTISHSDLNGYEIPEKLLSLVDDTDPTKFQGLIQHYKTTLLSALKEFIPKGLRFKQCIFELRAIPLMEIVYAKKKAKKSFRFLICGNERKAAILLNPKRH